MTKNEKNKVALSETTTNPLKWVCESKGDLFCQKSQVLTGGGGENGGVPYPILFSSRPLPGTQNRV